MKKNLNTKKLDEVCVIIGGGTPSKDNKEFYEGDIPWATVRDMKYDIIKETEFQISQEAVKSSSTNIIPKDNVIIATRVGLGKVSILENDTAINQDLKGIIPKDPDTLLIKYLFYWFKSISQIIEKEGTGATVKGVKLPFVKSLLIPIPPLSEQQRVVALIEESFEAINKAKEIVDKNLQNAKELFESYLQRIFLNKKETWEMKKWGEVCNFVRGPFGGSLKKAYFKEQGYAVYEQKHAIHDHFNKLRYFIDEDKFKEMIRFEVKPGDLIMSCSGVTLGRVAVVPEGIPRGIINQALLKLTPQEGLSINYLKHWLRSKIFQDIIFECSGGAAIPNVPSSKILKEIKIPVPSIEEQIIIVDKIENFFNETKKLESIYQQKLTNLDELKISILQKAFNGEL
jgi:type I restriction enzyme, S subunit